MPTDDGKSDEDKGDKSGEAQDAATEDHIVSLLEGGRKIAAIKLYRKQTGANLKEAKDFVEALATKHGISPKGAGCAGTVLLMVMVSTIIVIGVWVIPG